MNALGNLLRKAGRIVPREPLQYRTFNGNVTNDIGNIVSTYSEWHEVMGHVQPGLTFSFNARGVSDIGEIAKRIGIDQSKKVITVFVYDLDLKNVHDHDTPDQIKYKNCIYNIWSISDWFDYDGWQSLICIEDTRERVVEPEPEPEPPAPVVYTTTVKFGLNYIQNPLSKPFELTSDFGGLKDQIQFVQPNLLITLYDTVGWGVQRLVANTRLIQPKEIVCYARKSNSDLVLTWGADE